MDEIYSMIEQKIKEAGYPGTISGADVYSDICDQIEQQENGTYMMLSRFDQDIVLEYRLTVYDDNFNLEKITIRCPEGEFTAVFDD